MPLAAIKTFAQKTGKSEEEIERYWEEAKEAAKSEKSKGDEAFYGTAMKILKNKLRKHAGLTESRLSSFLAGDKMVTESIQDVDFIKDFVNSGRAYDKGFTEKDADSHELDLGIKVEKEHTSNMLIAKRIALDHLSECADYYTRLAKMEKECGVEDDD